MNIKKEIILLSYIYQTEPSIYYDLVINFISNCLERLINNVKMYLNRKKITLAHY